MKEKILERLISNIIPILLAAMFSVIGFLVVQLFLLNNKINELKVDEIRHYMELTQKIEVQKVTIDNLQTKMDRLNHGGGLSYERFSQMDFSSYCDSDSLYPLDL